MTRLRLLGRVLFGVLLVASLVSFLTPADDLADPGVDDKVMHALTFLALTLSGVLAGVRPPPLLAGLAAYAVGTEVLQHLLPLGRHGDALDALADLVGVLVGLLLATGARTLSRRARPARPAAPAPPRAPRPR
ncbi:hypothetical protein ASG49_02185 [Marmoricola sp. Leaf446]|uniref:hypothetical protein n=1 Tax=Marmoricola sp. Leaf446 TaxID=1736379 RepID=UPI000701C6B2|nr:hypothetical protein [Marmoricola sp. Leaf446]KQT93804.1 hypothetical protein ASG49_02185 [Marmoricola sp. Leaf446]